MRIVYKKPKIIEKRIKVNMFLRNNFISSIRTFEIPLFAAVEQPPPPPGPGTCFLKGTKILMSDGSFKQIEEIAVGDLVFSFNLETKNKREARVTELVRHKEAKDGYLIINGALKVTPEHLIFLNDGWMPADSAKMGDKLISESGEEITIDYLERVNNPIKGVYNLHLDSKEHNFFAEGILVHNLKYVPCLSYLTKIATPQGDINVSEIKEGQLVLTFDKKGKVIAAPVIKISKNAVSDTHKMINLVLEDGRQLFVSPYHPTPNGKCICELKIGEKYDGSIVLGLELVPYNNGYTYDILPAGDTGGYWANTIMMGSTLAPSVFEETISIHA